MALALSLRRNRGAPKRRARLTKTRNSAAFKAGQRAAARVAGGRRISKTQNSARSQLFELIRKHGTKKEIDLLSGPATAGGAAHDFRKGVRSVAADIAGFKPSASSGKKSKAAKSVKKEYKRDKKDTKKTFKATSADAMAIKHKYGVSLKDAWAIAKGDKPVPGSKRKTSTRKASTAKKSSASSRQSQAKRAMTLYHSGKADSLKEAWAMVKGVKGSGKKTSTRARKNPSNFGAEFLFI